MKARTILVFSAVLAVLAAGNAAAQTQKLSLSIEKGLVTIDVENVTVDEVLARWSQTTGLNVISKSNQGSDIPVSLHLEGVSEREALTAILRDLSGFIMGDRRDPITGIVTIDRLMILPQSAAQASPVPAARPRQPFLQPRPVTALALPEAAPEATPVELAPVERTAGDAAAKAEVPVEAKIVDFIVDTPGAATTPARAGVPGTPVVPNAFDVSSGFRAGEIAPAEKPISMPSPSEVQNRNSAPK